MVSAWLSVCNAIRVTGRSRPRSESCDFGSIPSLRIVPSSSTRLPCLIQWRPR